ncbi:hypothetical protein [Rhodospira trueperi]|nr:hypothetical protein [Rhodospira trueperi]
MLHSEFYSVLERGILNRLRDIAAMGHAIGLHFDPTFYGQEIDSRADLERFISEERALLERLLHVRVETLSFHMPDTGRWQASDDDEVAGLINAFGRGVRDRFAYCSDSNGYWRFQRLADVLEAVADERLHVLTHPCWWTPEPMAPRQRMARVIGGRADWLDRHYDSLIADSGRVNLRHADQEAFTWLLSWDEALGYLVEELIRRRVPHLAEVELRRRLADLGIGDESRLEEDRNDHQSNATIVALIGRLRGAVTGAAPP